jgi:hypothetical protein
VILAVIGAVALARMLISLVMADPAACAVPEQPVMTGKVPGDTANDGALQAALGRRPAWKATKGPSPRQRTPPGQELLSWDTPKQGCDARRQHHPTTRRSRQKSRVAQIKHVPHSVSVSNRLTLRCNEI